MSSRNDEAGGSANEQWEEVLAALRDVGDRERDVREEFVEALREIHGERDEVRGADPRPRLQIA